MAEIIKKEDRVSLAFDFKRLVGQERVEDILSRAIKSNILPHAYLFLGADGTGKEAAAIELAKNLLCLSDQSSKSIESGHAPCDNCPSCVQVDKLSHPNLRILFPLPKPKDSSAGQARESYTDTQQKHIDEILSEKTKNLYAPLRVSGGQEILIEHIRALRQEFRLTSYSGGWRIVLISNADRIRVQAANAFLKLLEEPPQNVMFILTSSRESKILPTILSRCQVLRFSLLTEPVIASELQARYNLDFAKANASARLSGGSWYSAVKWAQEDPKAEIQKAVDVLRKLVQGDPGEIDSLTDSWGTITKIDDFSNLLGMLSKWLRDVQKYDADPDGQVDLGQDESIIKFAKFTEGRDLESVVSEIELARNDLERRVQPSLVAHKVFLTIWKRLFSKQPA